MHIRGLHSLQRVIACDLAVGSKSPNSQLLQASGVQQRVVCWLVLHSHRSGVGAVSARAWCFVVEMLVKVCVNGSSPVPVRRGSLPAFAVAYGWCFGISTLGKNRVDPCVGYMCRSAVSLSDGLPKSHVGLMWWWGIP